MMKTSEPGFLYASKYDFLIFCSRKLFSVRVYQTCFKGKKKKKKKKKNKKIRWCLLEKKNLFPNEALLSRSVASNNR
jgi:hypothetical protein